MADAAAPAAPASGADRDAGTNQGPTLFELGPLAADAPFEGTMTLQAALTDDPEGTGPARYSFTMKGKKVRWDLFSQGGRGAPTGYRIYDGAQHRFFTVLGAVVYATDEAPAGDAGAPKRWTFAPFKLEPKGAVLGVSCDRKEADDAQLHYSVCLATGLPTLPLQLLGSAIARTVPFGATLEDQGLFPLSVVVRPRKGPADATAARRVGTLTVLEINRGRVPGAAFEIPPYRVVESQTLPAPSILR